MPGRFPPVPSLAGLRHPETGAVDSADAGGHVGACDARTSETLRNRPAPRFGTTALAGAIVANPVLPPIAADGDEREETVTRRTLVRFDLSPSPAP